LFGKGNEGLIVPDYPAVKYLLVAVIGVFVFYLFSRQILWREVNGRFLRSGQNGRNEKKHVEVSRI
jgi:hypothetical protein